MVAMKAAHAKADGIYMGVNVYDEGVLDMLQYGVVEPMVVKQQAIKSGVEVASMILRIDDIVAAKSGEGPGGMGEGPGGELDEDTDF
jgi:chaperonin GroEL (HSP60 family)